MQCRYGLTESELKALPFARLWQKAQVAGYYKGRENSSRQMDAAWVSYVIHRSAPMDKHQEWDEWIKMLGLAEGEALGPTAAEKEEIRRKVAELNRRLG